MSFDEDWQQDADEYGPVTDLVFSLFAVAVLLLAILGSDGKAKPPKVNCELEQLASGQASADPCAPQAPAPPAPPPVVAPPPKTVAEPVVSQSEFEKLRGERDTLAASVAKAKAVAQQAIDRLKKANDELEMLRLAPFKRVEIGVIQPADPEVGFLERDHLARRYIEEIRGLLATASEPMVTIGANRLVFEVDSAARLHGTRSDLDYQTSSRISADIVSALRRTPVPANCFVAIPFGKTRATSVTELGGQIGGGKVLDGIDSLGEGGVELPSLRSALNAAASDDERIVVVIEHVVESPCDPAILVAGAERWAEATTLLAPP